MNPQKIPPKPVRDERKQAYRDQERRDRERQEATEEVLAGRRSPPHDANVERGVLAGITWSPTARTLALEQLTEPNFYLPQHGRLFRAIAQLEDEFREIDALVIKDKLKELGLLEEAGGEAYVDEVLTTETSGLHIGEYIEILLNQTIARRLHNLGQEMIADVHAGGSGDAPQILARADQTLSEIAQGALKETVDLVAVMNRIFTEQIAASTGTEVVHRISTGYSRVDALLGGGLRGGAVLGIGARTGEGKTTLASSIVMNVMLLHSANQVVRGKIYTGTEYGVAYFTLEQSEDDLIESWMANMAEVPVDKIERRSFSGAELEKLEKARKRLTAWRKANRLHLEAVPGITISALVAKIQRLHRTGKYHVFVIDYLQLIDVPGLETREQIATAARKLQQLTLKLKLHTILNFQLNRGPEERKDTEPRLSDCKGSGEIEESLWTCMMPYRDPVDEGPNVNTMRVKIAKNRKGPTTRGEGNVKLTMRGDWGKVLDRGYSDLGFEISTGGPSAQGVPVRDYTEQWGPRQ